MSKKSAQNTNRQLKRRRNINRIKTMIVFLAALLLLTSVILNFVLMIKIYNLEEQVNSIYSAVAPMTRYLIAFFR